MNNNRVEEIKQEDKKAFKRFLIIYNRYICNYRRDYRGKFSIFKRNAR